MVASVASSSRDSTTLPRSVGERQQYVQVVVGAEQARDLLGLARPARTITSGQARRQELHVAPMLLHRLAPLVKGFVAGFS